MAVLVIGWNKTEATTVLTVCRSNGRVSVRFFCFGRVVYTFDIYFGGFGANDQVSGSPGPILAHPMPVRGRGGSRI